MDPTPDAELMARVKMGDERAFAELVDRHKDAVFGYLCRLTGCRERAEELGQEAFLRLYTSAPSYRENGHLKAYLFRIATNLVRSDARRERRRRLLAGWFGEPQHALAAVGAGESAEMRVDDVPLAGGVPPAPDRQAENNELQERIVEALATIPLVYRVPIVLHDIEEWTYDEIARATGSKQGTVKSRISRGRQMLRCRLEPLGFGVTS